MGNLSFIIESLLSIVAVIISIKALAIARHTDDDVGSIHRSAEEISNSISTRYVGHFPGNIPEITKLVASTKSKLYIVCDVPAYGHFSDPHEFELYRHAINDLVVHNPEIKITIIAYDYNMRIKNMKQQFAGSAIPFAEFDRYDGYIKYTKYYNANPNVKPPVVKNEEGFLKWLEIENRKFIDLMINNGVSVYEVSTELKVFAWISDDKAIFSFYNYGNKFSDVSFKTHDQPFIAILKEIAEDLIGSFKQSMWTPPQF